jgi:hypothetical protein
MSASDDRRLRALRSIDTWITLIGGVVGIVFALGFRLYSRAEPKRDRDVSARTRQTGEAEFIALCSAEYQVMMGRVTNWTVLQYALWPIVIGFYAFIADHVSDVPPALRPWLLAAVLPVAYLAYQSAMVDALGYILWVEGELRPKAAAILRRDDFWNWESRHRRTRAPNPAYWYGWPPLLSFISVATGLVYAIRGHYQPWWVLPVCLAITSIAALVVLILTLQGRRLDRSINLAVGLSESGKEKIPSGSHSASGAGGRAPHKR